MPHPGQRAAPGNWRQLAADRRPRDRRAGRRDASTRSPASSAGRWPTSRGSSASGVGVERAPIVHEIERRRRARSRSATAIDCRDAPLPRARRQHDDAQQLDLLDRAGLAGLRRGGRPASGSTSPSTAIEWSYERRNAIQSDWKIDYEGDRGGDQRARRRRPRRRAGRVAIAVAWALALAAEAARRGGALHHDALLEDGPAAPGGLVLFLVAWQVMIAAMMLPSSLPLMRLFARASARPAAPGARRWRRFLGGYALVWSAFGVARVRVRRRRARRASTQRLAAGGRVADRRGRCSRWRAPSSSRR